MWNHSGMRGGDCQGAGSAAVRQVGPEITLTPALRAAHFVCAPGALPGPGVHVRQVHGAVIHEPTHANGTNECPEADGILWNGSGPLALHIKTADCLPIIIGDVRHPFRYAVLHAGWRGLVAGIIGQGVARFQELGSAVEDLVAYIGPAICQKHYQVGEDLVAAFSGSERLDRGLRERLLATCFLAEGIGPQATGKFLFDLRQAAQCHLLHCGLGTQAVSSATACTYEEASLPSYRRDGGIGLPRLVTTVASIGAGASRGS